MVYFIQILHTYACQHCLTTGMCYILFDGRGFAEHQSDQTTWYILITYTSKHCLATGMQNGDEALPKDSTAAPASQIINSKTALTDTEICKYIIICQYSQPCLYSMCLKSKQYCTTRRCELLSLCESVRRSVHRQLVKMLITLEPHGNF